MTSNPHRLPWAGWTESEEVRLREWYALPRSARMSQAELGRQLGGRSANAISQRARLLGLTRRRPIDPDELREMHSEGWSDREIAEELGTYRATVRVHRRRLGLSSNKLSARQNARRSRAALGFCRRDGWDGLYELRDMAFRLEALRAGWPPEAGRGGTRILDALEAAGGPVTTRDIQKALGLKDRPRTTLTNLAAIGAIAVTRRRGCFGGNLYRLTIERRKPGKGAG